MTVYLVRHAAAGSRSEWRGPDRLRPLTSRGRAQARGLLELLRDARFGRVVSSPFVRCMETVVPLAGAHGLAVEVDGGLAEGADVEATLALVKQMTTGGVLCSHGDVIPAVLDHLRGHGVTAHGDRCEKGSIWVLETDGGAVRSVRYLSPLEA